jgi:hypothetical protein
MEIKITLSDSEAYILSQFLRKEGWRDVNADWKLNQIKTQIDEKLFAERPELFGKVGAQ